MQVHLVAVSKGKGLGDTETTAWGQSFKLGRDFTSILVCRKAINRFAFLRFLAGLLFLDMFLFSS